MIIGVNTPINPGCFLMTSVVLLSILNKTIEIKTKVCCIKPIWLDLNDELSV